MKEQKLSSDISTAVISVLLSTVLILLAVLLSVYYSAVGLFSRDGMSNTARYIGYEGLRNEFSAIGKSFAKYGANEQNADKFLRSAAVKDAAALYGEDIISVLKGDVSGEAKFNTENVQTALVKNLDGLVDIFAGENVPEEKALEIESKIVSAIKNNTEKVVKTVADKKEISKLVKNSGLEFLFKTAFNPTVKTIIWLLFILIALLILFLRYYNFGGFVWLGTDLIFSSVIELVTIIILFCGAYGMLFGQDTVMNALIFIFAVYMILAFLLNIAAAIFMYVVHGKLKKFLKRRKNAM